MLHYSYEVIVMTEQHEQIVGEQAEPMQPVLPKRRVRWPAYVAIIASVVMIVGIVIGVSYLSGSGNDDNVPSWVDVQLIDNNGSGKCGVPLRTVTNIVVHYVGNPNTSAQNNRNYFNQPATVVSSHFIVGLEGEVIQCVPLSERSAASNHRNSDTISIEVCHPDETGQYNEKTYRSLIRLCAWLCDEYGLEATDLIRHYDVTGKLCPLYYVEHPEAWEQLIQDVANYEE